MPRISKHRFLRVGSVKAKIRLKGHRLGEAQEEALSKIIRAGVERGCGCPFYIALDLRGTARKSGANYRFSLETLIRHNPEIFRLGRVGDRGGYGALYIGPGSTVPEEFRAEGPVDLHPDVLVPHSKEEGKSIEERG